MEVSRYPCLKHSSIPCSDFMYQLYDRGSKFELKTLNFNYNYIVTKGLTSTWSAVLSQITTLRSWADFFILSVSPAAWFHFSNVYARKRVLRISLTIWELCQLDEMLRARADDTSYHDISTPFQCLLFWEQGSNPKAGIRSDLKAEKIYLIFVNSIDAHCGRIWQECLQWRR